jgi:hydroxyethylthiazole kinase
VIFHLTNWVTISNCANIVKMLGACPVMAHAAQEVEEMARLASALVLNIGTVTPEFLATMKLAAKSARARGLPVVLDACGAGTTALRNRACRELLDEVGLDLLKGNAWEIASLGGLIVPTRCVDAAALAPEVREVARQLARDHRCTVVVTGPEDLVTDGRRQFLVRNGVPMMAQVAGTGCMAASVMGAFAAVEPDLALAATAALVCFGVAAECAIAEALGPATFKERLFDCLFSLDQRTIDERQQVWAPE